MQRMIGALLLPPPSDAAARNEVDLLVEPALSGAATPDQLVSILLYVSPPRRCVGRWHGVSSVLFHGAYGVS
jgi:hypothetical protein